MMPSSIRYHNVVLPRVSCMALLWFILLFLLLTFTTIIWHHILYAYFNSFPRLGINSRSRVLLVLWTRPTRKTTTKKLCARLTLVHCLQTFHLMRQYKFALTNWIPPQFTNTAPPSLIIYLPKKHFYWPVHEMAVAVASWFRVRSTLERAHVVWALAGDILLRYWARHLTPTVPLSSQLYK